MKRDTEVQLLADVAVIKKLLENHLAHHEINFNRWVKVYIPTFVTALQAVAFLVGKHFK